MSKKTEKKPAGKAPVRSASKAASKPAKSGGKPAPKSAKPTKGTAPRAAAKAAPRAAAKATAAKAVASAKPAPSAKTQHGAKNAPIPPALPRPKPLPRSAAIFKVGDHVVYPFHGVGVIKSLDKLNITGEEQWYYNLDFRNGELTVKLPVSQQSEKGMRKVIVRADVEKVMVVLKKKPPSEESDWKVRHNAYLEDLKSGDIYKAAKVARNLSKRGPEGELSMSEKRLLEAAVQQLVQEIAEASREPIEKVETEISKCLRAGRT